LGVNKKGREADGIHIIGGESREEGGEEKL